jgi:hypothetical protein
MITKTFKLLALVSLFFLVALFSQTALAWDQPPAGTPPACDTNRYLADGVTLNSAYRDGCNSPINAGSVTQSKSGKLQLNILYLNESIIPGNTPTTTLSNTFASLVSGYGYLNIFGRGTPANRTVKIWENLIVPGNIYAKNYYICSGDGTNCNQFTGGSSYWTKVANQNEIVYPNAIGVAGATDPNNTLTGRAVDIAIGTNLTGIKADTLGVQSLSLVTNGTNRLSIASNGIINVPSSKTVNFGTGAITGNPVADPTTLEIKGVPTTVGAKAVRKVTIIDSLFTSNLCTGTDSCVSVRDIINYISNPVAGYWAKDTSNNITANNTGTTVSIPNNKVFKVGGASLSSGVGYGGTLGLANLSNNNAWFNGTTWSYGSAKGSLVQLYDKDIYFYSNDGSAFTNNMIIKGDTGNVGVGLANPLAKLDVNGSGYFNGGVIVNGVAKIGLGAGADGKIGAKLNTSGNSFNLDMIGVSQDGLGMAGDRRVKIWDNLLVPGKICDGNNNCQSTTNIVNNIGGSGTNYWTTGGGGIYYANVIGVGGATAPNSGLDLAVGNNSTGLVGDSTGSLKMLTSTTNRLTIDSSGNSTFEKAANFKGGLTMSANSYVPGTLTLRFGDYTGGSGTIGMGSFSGAGSGILDIVGGGTPVPGQNTRVVRIWDKLKVNELCSPDAGTCATVSRIIDAALNVPDPKTNRVYCQFYHNGNTMSPSSCGYTTNENDDWVLSCPGGYRVVSGGGWCDGGGDRQLRESRPNDGSMISWKISCTISSSGAKVIPGGGSVICEQ